MDYQEFLKQKIKSGKYFGFDIDESDINPMLFPHQKDIVRWCIKGGRRAIFASFGLGKSFMQLEILRLIQKHKSGNQLIVAPLGVIQEFKVDAEKLGINITFIRKTEQVTAPGLYITNYESVREEKLDINLFNGVSLDEASVLRSYGSKTFQTFLTLFDTIPYRFVATATPSPNRFKELIHYSGFLGIMDSGQALTRFFQRDSTKANQLTLYPHKEAEFWLWMHGWAIFLQKPSDLGYSDLGYDLPKLNVHWHCINHKSEFTVDRKTKQMEMFSCANMSLTSASKEKRDSIDIRIEKMKDIIDSEPDNHFIVWHDQEEERHRIKKQVPSCKEVYGSLDLETREQRVIDFSNGKFQYIATKPILSGSGVNWQRHCHNAIYLGIGFKFNDFIQSIHRIYRFQQDKECNIHIIYTSNEKQVVKVLKEKWANHNRMVENMAQLIKKHGLSHIDMASELSRSMGIERIEVTGKNFIVANNDCVAEAKLIEDNSMGLIVTSIPFSNHYEYTPCYDETTEVLTRRGWKLFSETNLKDSFATINQESLLMEWQNPSEIIWRPYKGDMLHFYQKGVYDLLVTPDHKMFVDTRVGNKLTGRKNQKFELLQAKDFENNFIHRKWKMLSSVEDKQDCNDVYFVEIPETEQGQRGIKAKKINPIQIDDFLRLGGWYLSEGYCDHINDTYSRHDGRITISQSSSVNPLNVKEIKDLFIRIGLKPTIRDKSITVHSKSLSLFLVKTFGSNSYHKFIPQWIKDLPVKRLKVLRDTMMKGDGSTNGMAYTSFSEQLQNDFQEICFYSGWRTALSKKYNTIRISQNRVYPEIRTAPKKIYYDGMIGCATVPNHTLVVRRNGKVIVSGNCFNDFGHTENNDHFWAQMDYLTPELLRVLIPGRIYACHVKDRINFGNVTGAGLPTVSPFHMEAAFHAIKHGFDYCGMITVSTDVVRENNQTYRLGWTEQCKDGSKMGVGSPEYILLFHKPQTDRTRGYSDVPVKKEKTKKHTCPNCNYVLKKGENITTEEKDTSFLLDGQVPKWLCNNCNTYQHFISESEYSRSRWQIDAHAFWRSSGDRLVDIDELSSLTPDIISKVYKKYDLENIYDYETHVKIGENLDLKGCLPSSFMSLAPNSKDPMIWTDVNRMLTLNGSQSRKGLALHVCPLQTDIVDRLITRYSNKNEWVYDPFGGLGTVPSRAIKLGRKGRSSELNPNYFLDSVKYMQAAEISHKTPSLFDFIEAQI